MTPARLSLLVDRHFLGDCCANRSERYRSSFRRSVRLWASDLGREPTTEDLNAEAIAAFLRHLRHAGYGVERRREYRTRIRTLWAYAHRLGISKPPATVGVNRRRRSTPPRGEAETGPAKTLELTETPAEPGTVRHYFKTVYAPQQLIDKCPAHVAEHWSAIRSLIAHYGRDLQLVEQVDALAADHFAWMKLAGKSNYAINNVRRAWFAQWRHAATAGLVDRHPTVKKFKVPRQAPDAWTIEEMKRMLSVADTWWRAILLVGYWTLQRRRAL
jgi:hypothetical protein